MTKTTSKLLVALSLGVATLAMPTQIMAKKPNILVIMADDIGWYNTSVYNHGMLGYKTPNIDSIAHDGVMFTDAYGQQSCTAGRAAFITGQSPKRTGLLKIGMPGDKLGLQKEDPTIAVLLKPLGYATGQFGKNHLGDRDEHLPTNHGFDEFFGNLYHLNAEEEPENPDYPKDPEFLKKYGPRGVIHSFADGKIEDTGPLTKKRMETIDTEFIAAAMDFMDRQVKADKPFFLWFCPSRMHKFIHLKKESQGVTGRGIYADGMVEHDAQVGEILKKVDDLGIKDNTIVIYTTDNGAEKYAWPQGGTSPFRDEKATTWEGGIRVPFMLRWPGKIKGGQVSNEILSLEDALPTLLAAVGEPDIKEKLLKGYKAGDASYKIHLDGYNFLSYLKGEAKSGPRDSFFAFVDDGSLGAMRHKAYKFNFSTQNHSGFDAWLLGQDKRKAPMVIDILADPFEMTPEDSSYYDDWINRRMFLLSPMTARVGEFMATFKEFPPRQDPTSFTAKD